MINGILNLLHRDQFSCSFVHIGCATPPHPVSTVLQETRTLHPRSVQVTVPPIDISEYQIVFDHNVNFQMKLNTFFYENT